MTRHFDARKMRDWRERPAKPSTPAQDAARARAWRIVRLRGLWFSVGLLGGWRAKSARALVDDALKEIGAEPQGVRRAREQAETEAQYLADQQMEAEEHD